MTYHRADLPSKRMGVLLSLHRALVEFNGQHIESPFPTKVKLTTLARHRCYRQLEQRLVHTQLTSRFSSIR